MTTSTMSSKARRAMRVPTNATRGRCRVKSAAAVGMWLVVWQLASWLVQQPLILPGPVEVLAALWAQLGAGALWTRVAFTAARVGLGLLCAFVLAFVLAGASQRFDVVCTLVRPPLVAIKSTPVVCLVVLLLMWLGAANVSAAAVFLMALPGVYFPVLEGLGHADVRLREMFSVHGVRGLRRFLAFTWPQVLPFVLASAETVVGMAWKAGVAAELIGLPLGSIGERIYQAKLLLETGELFAWTCVVVALAWACERLVVRILRWSGPAGVRLATRIGRRRLRPQAVVIPPGPAVVARGLTLAHGTAASDLSFELPAGGHLCILAPSGVGKTTLLRTIAGLEIPRAGSIEAMRPCAVEFQEARLVEAASALDNVMLTARAGVGSAQAEMLLCEAVPGLDPRASVRALSGGQRRRVELVRALEAPSSLVVLDEPFSGLDEATHEATCALLARELRGRALVVATHDADDAGRLGAAILRLG